MPLLTSDNLHKLSPDVSRFSYDRRKLKPRIVHLGIGAFARAHLALYTEDAMGSDGDWGIVGVSLRHPGQRDHLAPQDFLYSATEVSNETRRSRVVGCLLGIMVAKENPAAVVSRMAAAETEIVSLTVTEKGYLHIPATGRLNLDHPDIRSDLATPHLPRTAVGMICAALQARHAAGLPPFTVLSCDNLPGNGKLLSRLVQDYAAIAYPALAGWITSNVQYPCSMVDRIVPALVQDDIDSFEHASGLRDSAPVRHEPFRQWVLEDSFSGARPPWHNAGAHYVQDVIPYEQVKLRMLNGAHSALAYLGYLAGHETIASVMADPPFASYVQQLWSSEIIPTLQAPAGLDLQAYANQLSSRFSNTAIHHRTWQIAMDGSQKIPQRLLASVRARLSSGASIELLCTAIAGWMRYVEGTDEAGRKIDVQDPFYDVLQSTLRGAGSDSRAKVRALLSLEQVFGSDLQLSSSFAKSLELAHEQIAIDRDTKDALEYAAKGLGQGAASVNSELQRFVEAIGKAGNSSQSWRALQELAQTAIGSRLFTVMTVDMNAGLARRAHSSHPTEYPVSGTKPIHRDSWFDIVHGQKRSFVANTIEDIAAVFPDHELIASLGCGSVLNLPVIMNSDLVATVNMLDAAHHFTPQRVATAESLLAMPARLSWAAAALFDSQSKKAE